MRLDNKYFVVINFPKFPRNNSGNNQELMENDVLKITELTITHDGAKKFPYAKSTKHRVHNWYDIKVNLYILN